MRSCAIILFLILREFVIWHKARMLLPGVIPDRPVCPTVIDAILCPDFVNIFRHFLDKGRQLLGQLHALRSLQVRLRLFHIYNFLLDCSTPPNSIINLLMLRHSIYNGHIFDLSALLSTGNRLSSIALIRGSEFKVSIVTSRIVSKS